MYESPALLIEGRVLETIPECGARCGRPATAARNRRPSGGPGHRPPGNTTWLRGARCTGCGGQCRRRKRGPRPKNATVERREASASRMTRVAPAGATTEDNAPVGAPPPLGGGGKFHGPGRRRAVGMRCAVCLPAEASAKAGNGLFDIVRMRGTTTEQWRRALACWVCCARATRSHLPLEGGGRKH